MSLIFKNYYIFENDIFFYVVCGIVLSIIIACFVLGYTEIKKGEKNANK